MCVLTDVMSGQWACRVSTKPATESEILFGYWLR